jgi:predicted nucleic acid-binding protein
MNVVDSSAWLEYFAAARLSLDRRLPTTDSIMPATAQAYHATLWTQDADFDGVTGVNYRAARTR